jgi:hypothetical protein
MRATIMYRAGAVRIENVPDATIVNPTDAVIRITRAESAHARAFVSPRPRQTSLHSSTAPLAKRIGR